MRSQSANDARMWQTADATTQTETASFMNAPLAPPELLDPIVAHFRPRRVVLFGSRARGGFRPDSDIDLLVVVDDDTPPEKVTSRAGFEAQRPYHEPADVIPVRDTTFQRKSRIACALARAATLEGVVVYERP
jgi:uncharacterized protein